MKLNELSFDLQTLIFFFTQNPNLATVSKSFYNASHNPGTILKCLLNWDILGKERHSYLENFKRMNKNENLIEAIINKDTYISKLIYDPVRIFYSSLEHDWLGILRSMLSKTTLERALTFGNKTGEIDSQKPVYSAKAMIDINSIRFSYRSFKEISFEAFTLLETAHTMQVDISKQHGITAQDLIGGNIIVYITKN
ncbi:hypothetical protein BB559_004826 [Furculomyces boomerangus]|uniref:Uncharacterized protein n=1 Tax=Furculomyces boomerangus TaxID=61424 RepID=A0A2T9YCH9_9FUNG|nr:hypothetical protein BB559_004826 [Furculomyces boomerangus]